MQENSLTGSTLSIGEFKGLFKSLHPSLCVFANGYLNNLPAAKDVVQEVFIKMWENKTTFKNINAVKPYLYKAVKNRCLDLLKSKRVRVMDNEVEVEELEIIASDSYFYREVLLAETTTIITNAVNNLPPKCSEIINLSLRNYSNQEIADILSLSVHTVKAQKKIAYQKLRPMLKEYYQLLLLVLIS
ncbi:RNA polymerase sigma-70 factor [Abyssalbus ytuae]|uniref:RNA polymerase sigma factor SigS n=1 Tax=Abyssalbus ytuae TaxID=2926907 RepID=A0A9E6ZU01_9FLAO|nr:RNA polymerase sigma-70 factor [Abyssalbus ytuae]UOB16681.1 RNA polymerase sigma-70 factor [Abyssalbus ytuae]